MNLTQHAPLARRTMKELPFREHMVHMGLGIVGELGEFAGAIKKNLVYLKPLDKVNLGEEGGDTFWYISDLNPEIAVDVARMELAFATGFEAATKVEGFDAGRVVIYVMARCSNAVANLVNMQALDAGEEQAIANVTVICRAMGELYATFGLDLAASLTANIEKLKARYGEKFTEAAALNRDLGKERGVLETTLGTPSADTPKVAAITGAKARTAE